MAKVPTPPPVPASFRDLSREGLIYLIEICPLMTDRYSIARARWHELCRAAEAADHAADAAWRDYSAALTASAKTRVSGRALAAEILATEKARDRERRARAAAERARAAETAFYDAHLRPQPAHAPAGAAPEARP